VEENGHSLAYSTSPACVEGLTKTAKSSVRTVRSTLIYNARSPRILTISAAHLTATGSVLHSISVIKSLAELC
jgi:hypothetical protein